MRVDSRHSVRSQNVITCRLDNDRLSIDFQHCFTFRLSGEFANKAGNYAAVIVGRITGLARPPVSY